MRRPSALILAICAVLIAVLAAWRLLAPAEVRIARPTRGPAVEAVYATGVVEPTLEIRIAPQMAGRIVELKVDEGDTVRKGQLLARLEDAELLAAAAELEARVEYARAQYERNRELRRSALISQDALERSRSELDAARAALRRARDQAQYMQLLAPTDGRIIQRDGEIGELVPVNQPIFYMAGPAPLRVTADVDEEDVPRVEPGLEVLIHSDAFPGRVFTGVVDQVTPRGDSTARSYRVRIALEDETPLRIGMTVETNILIEKRVDALLVPTTAVAGGHVWIVENGRALRREVTVGVVGPQRTEIRAGLEANESVIIDPPEGLEHGIRVRARPTGSDAQPERAARS